MPKKDRAYKNVKTAKGRKISSTLWLQRQLNDPYVEAAKKAGWRSRAAFKLLELDDKFHILKPGQRVVDLGAAPGGWAQVAAERCKSNPKSPTIWALDLLAIEPIVGVSLMQGDFTDNLVAEKLEQEVGGQIDVVLSDMAPSFTGHRPTDKLRSMALAELALDFALKHLDAGGHFVCKLFQSGGDRDFIQECRKYFEEVRVGKPPASRQDSAECFLVAKRIRKG